MKKLLALVLILAMASSASAVLTSYQGGYFEMVIDAPEEIGIGDVIGVEILAGEIAVSEMLNTVLNVDAAASISAVTISNEGDWSFLNENNGTTVSGDGYNVNVDGTLPVPIAAGSSIYSFSFTTLEAGTVTIDAILGGSWSTFEAYTGPDDAYYSYEPFYGLPYAELTVVPEPMTIVLLGLGGLFLRRRRS